MTGWPIGNLMEQANHPDLERKTTPDPRIPPDPPTLEFTTYLSGMPVHVQDDSDTRESLTVRFSIQRFPGNSNPNPFGIDPTTVRDDGKLQFTRSDVPQVFSMHS
ncbi:hypothetical protein PQX77_014520 [Marasmius sp. AFHP31]|nr:hypothetical protein PQX77_014520 [Marasmius sp. AFHP31]